MNVVRDASEGADDHEKPVEAVSVGEEARERNDGRRRLNLLGLLHIFLNLDQLIVSIPRLRYGDGDSSSSETSDTRGCMCGKDHPKNLRETIISYHNNTTNYLTGMKNWKGIVREFKA